MIRINCTNCKAQLSIDEAFAGGVCRCQFCGTIQTVPKHLTAPAGAAAAAAEVPVKAGAGAAGSAKALYRKKSKGDIGMSSGLDALAEIVASSGLSGSGLTSAGGGGRRSLSSNEPARGVPVPMERPPEGHDNNKQLALVLSGAGVLIVLLLGMVIGMMMRGGGGSGGGSSSQDGSANAAVPPRDGATGAAPSVVSTASPGPAARIEGKLTGPSFLHVQLLDPSIVFVLDRGQATQPSFNYMKMACLNAIESLRPEQRFQVIFWKRGDESEPEMYPREPIAAGNTAEVKRTAEAMENVFALGSSELGPSLEKAFASHPAAVVIATGKAVDESFVQAVMRARKDNVTKVYCLSLTESDSAKAMRDVAAKTGGTFRLVSLDELQSVSR